MIANGYEQRSVAAIDDRGAKVNGETVELRQVEDDPLGCGVDGIASHREARDAIRTSIRLGKYYVDMAVYCEIIIKCNVLQTVFATRINSDLNSGPTEKLIVFDDPNRTTSFRDEDPAVGSRG